MIDCLRFQVTGTIRGGSLLGANVKASDSNEVSELDCSGLEGLRPGVAASEAIRRWHNPFGDPYIQLVGFPTGQCQWDFLVLRRCTRNAIGSFATSVDGDDVFSNVRLVLDSIDGK